MSSVEITETVVVARKYTCDYDDCRISERVESDADDSVGLSRYPYGWYVVETQGPCGMNGEKFTKEYFCSVVCMRRAQAEEACMFDGARVDSTS